MLFSTGFQVWKTPPRGRRRGRRAGASGLGTYAKLTRALRAAGTPESGTDARQGSPRGGRSRVFEKDAVNPPFLELNGP